MIIQFDDKSIDVNALKQDLIERRQRNKLDEDVDLDELASICIILIDILTVPQPNEKREFMC